jgi:ABC-type Zn uptake system ZnuABC Zn-binding protein ZnuA
MNIRYYFALMFVLIPCNALAQSAVPNSFVPGTPANASEVNENFNALEDDINSIVEYFQQRYFVTHIYSTNINYSTSFGYSCSEVGVATCPSG